MTKEEILQENLISVDITMLKEGHYFVIGQAMQEYADQQLILHSVSNWVSVKDGEPPEVCTDVMVKYKDGRKEVAYFDGDYRFYIEKDDRDVTETIVEWHKLP